MRRRRGQEYMLWLPRFSQTIKHWSQLGLNQAQPRARGVFLRNRHNPHPGHFVAPQTKKLTQYSFQPVADYRIPDFARNGDAGARRSPRDRQSVQNEMGCK